MKPGRLLPLPTLVTPATLTIRASHLRTFENLNVPNLQISQYLNASSLAAVPQNDNDKNFNDQIYLQRFVEFYAGRNYGILFATGPSPRMTQMIQATASTGELFQKPRPVASTQGGNMTYQIETTSPGIRCGQATIPESRDTLAAAYTFMTGNVFSSNTTVNQSDYALLTFANNDPSANDYSRQHLYYFAMVPSRNQTTKQQQPLPLTLQQTESYNALYNTSLANRLWVAIGPGNASSHMEPTFLSCQLWNVSYSFNISFLSDRQTTSLIKKTYLNTVQPMVGWNDRDDEDVQDQGNTTKGELGANAARLTYTMFFLGICERIAGSVYTLSFEGGYNQVKDGGIQQTVLTGSTDYYAALIKGQDAASGGPPNLALIQSLQPTNKSLSTMIEELAVNVTANMLGTSYFR